jgi:HEAT repeat protein
MRWATTGWLLRAAALEALARRGDPSVLNAVVLCMSDENDMVKYRAAATVLRLTAIKTARARSKEEER